MTLRHLEIFMAVCRTMSMSKAAVQLGMSQPAVSKAIAELEAFYNVSLFDRLNRRIYLSEAGTSLLHYAEVILSQFEESVSFLKDENKISTCRLSVNVTAGESFLCELIRTIEKKLPFLQLNVSVHNSKQIEQMIRANLCDIGIIDEKDDSQFDSVFLCEERLGLFVSEQYRIGETIEAADLTSHRLLLRENGSGSRAKADVLLAETDYPLSEIWESASDRTLIDLARNGFGIALLPVSCVSPKDGLKEITIRDKTLSRNLYLVSLRNKYLSTQIRECMKLICSFCAEL